jgi:hypothetical protein
MLPFSSSKARVLSLAQHRPLPSHPRDRLAATERDRKQEAGIRLLMQLRTHQVVKDQTLGPARGSRRLLSHRTVQVAYGRVPSQNHTASPLWPCCCVHGIENNMGGHRPCQPGPRDFSVPRSPGCSTGVTQLESSPITWIQAVCSLRPLWRRGDSNP